MIIECQITGTVGVGFILSRRSKSKDKYIDLNVLTGAEKNTKNGLKQKIFNYLLLLLLFDI
jgi:hypothetical protein